MSKLKFKTTVKNFDKDVELVLDFVDNPHELCSAIDMYGEDVTKNARQYAMDDKDGNELYAGDKVQYCIGEHLYEEGIVTYGEFEADIFLVTGWYVADSEGKQRSEAGLGPEYVLVKDKNER